MRISVFVCPQRRQNLRKKGCGWSIGTCKEGASETGLSSSLRLYVIRGGYASNQLTDTDTCDPLLSIWLILYAVAPHPVAFLPHPMLRALSLLILLFFFLSLVIKWLSICNSIVFILLFVILTCLILYASPWILFELGGRSGPVRLSLSGCTPSSSEDSQLG